VRALDWDKLFDAVGAVDSFLLTGRVTKVVGLTVEAAGPPVEVGELCSVYPRDGSDPIPAEVVGFKDGSAVLMPIGDMSGVAPGARVVATGRALTVGVGRSLKGRVLDGLGRPADSRGRIAVEARYPLHAASPHPLDRPLIGEPLPVGVRAIDAALTCGKGQRIGIFSGSGVGKSTLLGMIARNTEADTVVVALVGERGREVRDFIERDLGPEGLERAVVVAATSDRPALLRVKAAFVATAVAEYFRDSGDDVLLLMDSVTRFAMAQREVGLAAGEPPTTRGYTPSVFAMLPKLLERTGTSARGTITGFYTVLVEGDDLAEPITDAVRGTLDGHILLSRDLAARGRYPAVDVLGSVSRLMTVVTDGEHQAAAGWLKRTVATYRDAEDLINVGAYADGSNPEIDEAKRAMPEIERFLEQGTRERSTFAEARETLVRMAAEHRGEVRRVDAQVPVQA